MYVSNLEFPIFQACFQAKEAKKLCLPSEQCPLTQVNGNDFHMSKKHLTQMYLVSDSNFLVDWLPLHFCIFMCWGMACMYAMWVELCQPFLSFVTFTNPKTEYGYWITEGLLRTGKQS